jgi:DNA polymerase III subunit epsilon
MTRSAWVMLVAAAVAQLALLFAVCWLAWDTFTPEERNLAVNLAQAAGSMPIVGLLALVGVLAALVQQIFSRWVQPLRGIAEATRLIALSNPKHRVPATGAREVRDMVGGINVLAERYQALGEDVAVRIQEANALLEEEKNTLSALMSKLTQGVLVCNPEGRILLYNPRAQRLLEGPAGQGGAGDWIGLGRSVYSVIDESLIKHSLDSIGHRLESGETNLMVPFVATRPGGQILSAQLVPIVDHDRSLRGYILTFVDVTKRFGAESRRGVLLHSLTEGQRSAIGGIRAAIETVLSFPEMDEEGRRQFFEVIRDEALKVSQHLDRLEHEHAQDLKMQLPVDDVLGSELLATVERTLRDTRNRDIEVSVPVEPIWLKVESYTIIQCLVFITDQLTQWCRAENLTLTLESRRALASLELQWTGAALHMEALHQWGLRNVSTDAGGSTRTLFEAIEQYGGVVWPEDRAQTTGRPCLRLILPQGEVDELATAARPEAAYGHDFDFHLFEHRGEARELMDSPLSRLNITVLDTETTGLDPAQGDEIIAVGAIRVINGRILRQESFDSFVRPSRPVSAASLAIHGITNEMLRAEARADEILPRLHKFVEDTVIVGHNVGFDMRFLDTACRKIGISFSNHVLDTLLLELAINANQTEMSLEAIAARLGLEVTGRHTALGDALTTAQIFLALIPLLAENGIHTLGDAVAACKNSPHAHLAQ